MSDAVIIEKLEKSYGSNKVLKGISFHVKQGEIFALLGINGAGKTTTLECIEGLRKYDSGNIRLIGKKGIQLQSSSLPSHIKVREAVELFARWNKVQAEQEMLSAMGIDELGKKQYIELSTGQKRRLHLALALLNDPNILFLDEPTAGLDVEGRISLHQEIRKLKEKGKTVILTSHDMAEVESLCDRIGILSKGELIFQGTVSELTNRMGKKYSIHIKTQMGEESYTADDIGETLLNLLEEYKKQNKTILDIKVDRGSLEEQFVEIAREEK